MEAKRARRRRDLQRMKAKAVRTFKRYGFSPEHLARRANNMALCSCDMCGNPRWSGWNKGERLTLQERRFMAEEVDEQDRDEQMDE